MDPANPLTVALLDTIQLARELQEHLHECREALRVAVEMLAEKDRALDNAREQKEHLRAELRAYVSGRTIAEERQALEGQKDEAA